MKKIATALALLTLALPVGALAAPSGTGIGGGVSASGTDIGGMAKNFSFSRYSYDAVRKGSEIHVRMHQRNVIRFHTGPNFAPYTVGTYGPTQILRVKSGQWLEVRLASGAWSLMTGADNR